jgi:yeast amino acid transporter
MKRIANEPADWDSPFSFFNHAYQVKDEDGNLQRTITGGVGTFLGVWYD